MSSTITRPEGFLPRYFNHATIFTLPLDSLDNQRTILRYLTSKLQDGTLISLDAKYNGITDKFYTVTFRAKTSAVTQVLSESMYLVVTLDDTASAISADTLETNYVDSAPSGIYLDQGAVLAK